MELPADQQCFTLRQVAKLFQVSYWTVVSWAGKGRRLRSLKIGRLRRITRQEIERVLCEGLLPVRAEPSDQK